MSPVSFVGRVRPGKLILWVDVVVAVAVSTLVEHDDR